MYLLLFGHLGLSFSDGTIHHIVSNIATLKAYCIASMSR